MTKPEQTVDYGEDVQRGPGDNVLAQIDHIANLQLEAEADVDLKAEELRLAKERLKDIAERQLPELMDAARQKTLTTGSDVEVKLGDKVRASIPEARKGRAFDWLREKSHGAMIRTSVDFLFEAGQDDAARAVHSFLLILATDPTVREGVKGVLGNRLYEDEVCGAMFGYLATMGEPGVQIQLNSSVHSQSLAALIRVLLKDGKIDQPTMELLGAHAWKETSVKRKN